MFWTKHVLLAVFSSASFIGCTRVPVISSPSIHAEVMQDTSSWQGFHSQVRLCADQSAFVCPLSTQLHLDLRVPLVRKSNGAVHSDYVIVHFAEGSAVLDDVERQKLDDLAARPFLRVTRVRVSTDSLGTYVQNRQIAADRFKVVWRQLTLRKPLSLPNVDWDTRCCYGKLGVSEPQEQDRHVVLELLEN